MSKWKNTLILSTIVLLFTITANGGHSLADDSGIESYPSVSEEDWRSRIYSKYTLSEGPGYEGSRLDDFQNTSVGREFLYGPALSLIRTVYSLDLSNDSHVMALGCVYNQEKFNKAYKDEFARREIIPELRATLKEVESVWQKRDVFPADSGLRIEKYDFENNRFEYHRQWDKPHIEVTVKLVDSDDIHRCLALTDLSSRSDLVDVNRLENSDLLPDEFNNEEVKQALRRLFNQEIKLVAQLPEHLKGGLLMNLDQAKQVDSKSFAKLAYEFSNLRWGWHDSVGRYEGFQIVLLADIAGMIGRFRSRDDEEQQFFYYDLMP